MKQLNRFQRQEQLTGSSQGDDLDTAGRIELEWGSPLEANFPDSAADRPLIDASSVRIEALGADGTAAMALAASSHGVPLRYMHLKLYDRMDGAHAECTVVSTSFQS